MRHDFVVIGGGAYGCGLAWQLAVRGADVLLLERGTMASGSSGGPGARGVRANGRDLRELPLARRAQELWPTLDERIGGPTGYRRTGGIRLFEQEVVGVRGGRVSMTAHAWTQIRAGIETRVLSRPELLNLEPDLAPQVTNGLYCPDDGLAEHELTTLSLAAAARLAGAELREHEPVRGLRWSGDRVVSVETDHGSIVPGKAVVVTANTGSSALLAPRLGFLPSWQVVPQVTFLRPRRPVQIQHLIGHDSRSLSLKPMPDGLVQVSGGWRGRWNADTSRGEIDPGAAEAAAEQAAAVYPALQGAAVISMDAGRGEGCSPDGIPIIDRVPGTANAFLATGWSGHGFALVPAVVEALAEWLVTAERPSTLAPFAYSRFA